MRTSILWRAAGALVLLVVVAQFVPYGRDHDNPPVTREPAWDSPDTRALAMRACFDCHSHETRWPWYGSIAPVSWMLTRHVTEGRRVLNFSAFDVPQEEAAESAESVRKGDMPPWSYTRMHADARLSNAERERLVAGLVRTFGDEAGGEGDED